MATKLILIRHGVTGWNLEKRYCGFKDIILSKQGKKQAEKLRQRLNREKIHKIYSSDKKRAIQTAKITFKGMKVERVADLREMHFGCFEGLTHREIIKKHSRIYKKWLDDPFSIAIPKGEKLSAFKKRVVSTFKKIISSNRNKTIAVVCHGGSISIFMTSILKTKDFWKNIPASGSLSIIEYKNGKPKIRIFNDASHLS